MRLESGINTMNNIELKRKFLRERLIQKLIVPFGRELQPQKWIFIIGCYNSGTTLLKTILSQHPDIAALRAEGVTLSDGLPRPEKYGWNRLWYKCMDSIRLSAAPEMKKVANRIKRQWSFSYEQRPILLEKSIANTARIPFFNAFFTPAFFIHIVRNGYAVAEGIRRKARPEKWGRHEYGSQYPIEMCAQQWVVSEQVVESDRSGIDNFISITYEDLVEHPAVVLRQITDMLEIDALEEDMLSKSWHISGLQSPIKNMNPGSLSRLKKEDKEKIEAVAKSTLMRYNYLAASS